MGFVGKFAAFAVVALAVAVVYLRREDESAFFDLKTPDVTFRGTTLKSRDGREISAFRGIPFAIPPIGELRFKKPQPVDYKDVEVIKATKAASVCAQPFDLFGYRTWMGSEDCLYLNVFTPKAVKAKEKLPVLVWIHGGGFTIGEGGERLYGPQFLLDRDIVLVTIQYRLGPLGFLNLGSEDASGNQAMWDQREALNWVQKHIEHFNGDKDKVTIAGESAGGMSVHSHLMSAQKPTYRGAIVQSGTLHSSFLNADKAKHLSEFHKKYSKELGCDDDLKCLQSKSVTDLLGKLNMFDDCNLLASDTMPFPTVWKPSDDSGIIKEPFFGEDPHKMMKRGVYNSEVNSKVKVMTGFLKEEGILTTGSLIQEPKKAKLLEDEWEKCFVTQFAGKFYADMDENDAKVLKKYQRNAFKGIEKVTLENSQVALTDAFTDSVFAVGTDAMVRGLVKKGLQVFYYRFDHVGEFSIGDLFSSTQFEILTTTAKRLLGLEVTSKGLGTAHADELFYLFCYGLEAKGLLKWHNGNAVDEAMSRLMVDLWVNFATFTHPTPEDKNEKFIGKGIQDSGLKWPWLPVKEFASPKYVTIKDAKLSFVQNEEVDKRIAFFRDEIEPKVKFTPKS